MARQLLNFKSHLVPVPMFRLIICVFSLFYLISCTSSTSSTPEIPASTLGAVLNLAVSAEDNQATVTWESPNTGIAATGYQLQYLTNVTASIANLNIGGDAADRELSKLSWEGATTVELSTNNTGKYTKVVDGLDVSAVNVFRVRAVVTDATKENTGGYRYYALQVNQIGEVRNLKVTDFTFSNETRKAGFTVSWDPPTEGTAIGYRVVYKQTDITGNDYQPANHTGIGTSYVFTNLNPGKPYEIKVSAKVKGEETGQETSITKYTPAPPERVPSITFAYVTASTVQIKWEDTDWNGGDPGDSLSGLPKSNVSYKVDIREDGMTTWNNVVDNYSDSTTVWASQLTKLNTYHVRVIAKNKWGDSEPTISSLTTGAYDPGPPSAVGNLTITSSTYNTVVLSWTVPDDSGTIDKNASPTTSATITNYIIRYKTPENIGFIEIDESSSEEKAYSLTGTTAIVTNLKVETDYTFSVVAVNSGNGVGPDKEVSHRFNLVTPELKEAACVTSTKVSLVWDASPGTGYYRLHRNGSVHSEILANNSYVNPTFHNDEGRTPGTTYTYSVQACSAEGKCSTNSNLLTITTLAEENLFKAIIDSGMIPADFTDKGYMSEEIFSHYYDTESPPATDVELVARYLKPGATGSGERYDDPTGDLKGILNNKTSGASAGKVYLVFVTGGQYNISGIAMKNHVAIVGGVDECLNPSTEPTVINGGGSVFYNNGNSLNKTALLYGVNVTGGTGFFNTFTYGGGMYNKNSSPSLVRVNFYGNDASYGGGIYNRESSPRLVKVTFSNNTGLVHGAGVHNSYSSPTFKEVIFFGNKVKVSPLDLKHGGGMANSHSSPILEDVSFIENETVVGNGGGLYNDNSSPSLVRVTFFRNKTGASGGGMYNNNSSPTLEDVTFSENTVTNNGGGMYNDNSSPILGRVTFSRNTAKKSGGGMYNRNSSSLTLIRVTFFMNRADWNGGGMFNRDSTLLLVGNTFLNNEASGINGYGGAMYNDINFQAGNQRKLYIYNSIFWKNGAGSYGNEFYIYNTDGGEERMDIYHSIITDGKNGLGEKSISTTELSTVEFYSSGFGANTSDQNIVISHSGLLYGDDPRLGNLANNGGSVLTHAIPNDSPAVDKGIFIKREWDNGQSKYIYYYSEDNSDWYTEPDLSGDVAAVPDDTEDLTGVDATGYTLKAEDGRPDLGAYEYRQ